MSADGPAPSSIGTATINPAAERVGGASTTVSSRDEKDFFDQGKAEHDYRIAKANMGHLGSLFGSSASAAVNIAGAVTILSMLIYFATFFLPATNADLPDVRKGLLGLIGTVLGFLFGQAVNKKD